MSTIATLTSTESGANSLTDINANFSALNTDKAEKSLTVNSKALSTNPVLTTADVADSTDKRYCTDAQKVVIGNTSGANTGDNAANSNIPVKAAGSDIDTGTNDAKFVTAKAINDSHNTPLVAPGTSGNVMTSDGTDWTSAAVTVPTSKNGTITRAANAGDGSVNTAHGLGKTPTVVRMTAHLVASSSILCTSTGFYNGSTTACTYAFLDAGAGVEAASDTTNIVHIKTTNAGATEVATITVDGTNITLAWTATSTPTGNIYIVWEVQ
jgi:hypothetical protein